MTQLEVATGYAGIRTRRAVLTGQRRSLGASKIDRDDLPRQAPRALEEKARIRWLRAVEQVTSPRDRCIALIPYYAGARISEVVRLDVGDVRRSARKGGGTAWSLQDLGAKLEILSGPLAGVYDPRGMGKIFFAMLAGFAEMEREMMIERTNDGLAQAAAEGRHGGRRPVISKDMMRIALGRRADGESVTSIAKGLTYKTDTP